MRQIFNITLDGVAIEGTLLGEARWELAVVSPRAHVGWLLGRTGHYSAQSAKGQLAAYGKTRKEAISRLLEAQQSAARILQQAQAKTLYIEGHNHRRGYAVALEGVAGPPVRYYTGNLRRVRRIVERFNTMSRRRASRNASP